ncbi:MAG: type 1 periplasmic-binding domain-containing protein [Candidatus Dormibacteria bacterium]
MSSAWPRRVPPLAMGALALALMIAILPSSLHLPTTGPGSQAEVAPVPGQGKTQANLSQLGLADSGTVGGGGSSALGDAAPPTPAVEEILGGLAPNPGVAQQSRCVGNPPRQTEDPLSPPCVGFWQGDNHGITWKGVTPSSITLIMTTSAAGHDNVDYTQAPAATDDPIDTTARVLLRYFQARFQTYGRKVRLISRRNPTSFKDIDAAYHPFAIAGISGLGDKENANAVRGQTMIFDGAYRPGELCPSTATLLANAPYEWCFGTSHEADDAALAGFVCTGLVGHPAAVSKDPTIASKIRKFGVVAMSQDAARPVIDALKQRCGLSPTFYSSDGSATATARMEGDGITTVINPIDETMRGATQAGYTPEWLAVGQLSANVQAEQRTTSAQIAPTEWNSFFALSNNWRWKPRPQPYYYQAAQEVSPAVQPDGQYGSSIYYSLLMAFTAIQMAGPDLTPSNVERALQTFTAAYEPPFSPHAGYTPGDHNFLDDYMIVRWDSSGSPPDGAAGSGCFRLADGGRRYLPQGPWPVDDRAAATGAADPCQADELHPGEAGADANQN